MVSFCLEEVKFFELLLVIFFSTFLGLSIFNPILEDVTLTRGVTFIFTLERAIKLGDFRTMFLTVFLMFLELGTLFVYLGVTVLV